MKVVSQGLHTLRGILLAEAGRCEDAMPVLESVSIDDLGWAEARIHLGDCKYKKNRYREAIECYLSITSTATTVHPFYREAVLRNIGFAYYDLRQYAKAVEYLTQVELAYDESPGMKAELFRILASAYSQLGMPQEAAKYDGFSRGSKSVQ
jgi:tetratricopeptide (TPR) repeat protein